MRILNELELADSANLLKIMGHPLRLKILIAIFTKQCKVTGLVDCIDAPQPIVSQQLAILRRGKIIVGQKCKNCVIYKIVNPGAEDIIKMLLNSYNYQNTEELVHV